MLDVELAAALFRAVDRQQDLRLVLVGDAGQLPPVGRCRVLAKVMEWLESDQPESLDRLRYESPKLSFTAIAISCSEPR